MYLLEAAPTHGCHLVIHQDEATPTHSLLVVHLGTVCVRRPWRMNLPVGRLKFPHTTFTKLNLLSFPNSYQADRPRRHLAIAFPLLSMMNVNDSFLLVTSLDLCFSEWTSIGEK